MSKKLNFATIELFNNMLTWARLQGLPNNTDDAVKTCQELILIANMCKRFEMEET